jgi:hypothetical protein
MVVYTQGHCWPQADFEDVSSGLCVWVCVCVSIPIGRLNFCSCLLLLTHFHLRLAVLTNDK